MKPLPGTHLHKLIKQWTGQDMSTTCKCRAWIAKMDRAGPRWCRKHINEIAAHMRAEAKKRNWWRFPAIVPGAQFVIRQMIELAIENSEKEAASNGQPATP